MSAATEKTWDTNFRWEQDRAGGAHGVATFVFALTGREVSLRVESFPEAFELQQAIAAELKERRFMARFYLLAEIARIRA